MKTSVKKLLSLLLVCVLMLGMVPAVAYATGTTDTAEDNSVTVYMSVSKHSEFVIPPGSGEPMALEKITVPYFDLADYGLDMLYYNPDCYAGAQVGGTEETANGKVTLLHLLIYATEIYYCGIDAVDAGKGALADELDWHGFEVYQKNPGSAFIFFWDFAENLNYYLNYEYPLGRVGTGSTCDQILLSDGDVVSVRYNAFTGNDGAYYHFGETGLISKDVLAGNSLNLTLFECTETADYSGTGHVTVGEGTTVSVYDYIGGEALVTGTTDSYGDVCLDTSSLAVGTYYVTSDTYDPAVMLLNITSNSHTHSYSAVVTAPTCTEGGYTTYTCDCGSTYTADLTAATGHTDSNGICTVCGQSTAVAMYGDVNGDNVVNAMDVSLTAQYAAGKTVTMDAAAADVNGDNAVNAMDVSLIAQRAAGKISQFPIEGTN